LLQDLNIGQPKLAQYTNNFPSTNPQKTNTHTDTLPGLLLTFSQYLS
jgi:hypothetical protein